ncbi:DNA-deoxyinosine glycosylase [Curvibacter sp. CHRR-16]|nr:DNA-deoxyinosine glycosylase [Curvibacter sp. CHRR-16]
MLHGLPPLVGPHTRVLILGSFPGVRSLQQQQYYAHPQNQFWRLLAALWPDTVPAGFYDKSASTAHGISCSSYEIRSKWLLERGLGLWDVYAHCERQGSLDSAIRNATPNDIATLQRSQLPQLQAIAHNGGESFKHARHTRTLGLPVYQLPSTSPANASWSFERKLEAWREVMRDAWI